MFNWLKRFMDWGGTAYTYTGGSSGNVRLVRSGWQTGSGTIINEDTALTLPAFLHGLRLYGTVLGALSWDLIENHDKGRSVARVHPIHRLLHDEPNEFQLASSFRETLIGHAIAYGNGYAWIERNGNFRPTAMIPLLPDRTFPVRTAGDLKYITYVNGHKTVLEPYEVFHVAGFSNNGLTGIPLVRVMAETLGLSKAEEQYCAAFFGNGCNFGGFITNPLGKTLSKEAIDELKGETQKQYSGVGNAFRLGYLQGGLDYKPFSGIDPEKSQLVQVRQFSLSDMARIIGLAPHLLYDLTRSTNNNIEHQGIEAVTYSFGPWANKLCQEANRKLLYESEKGIFEATLDLKPLMQGDAKTQAETDQINFNMCALTPNERRAKMGMNPIEGGDQLFVNMAVLPLNVAIERALAQVELTKAQAGGNVPSPGNAGIAQPNSDLDQLKALALNEGTDKEPAYTNDDPPPASNKDVYSDGPAVPGAIVEDANALATPARSKVIEPLVKSIINRLIRRESKAVENALRKHADDPEALRNWLTAHQQETGTIVAEALEPIGESLARIEDRKIDTAALADRFNKQTSDDLEVLLKSQKRADDLPLMIEGWQTQRSETFITELLEGKP